MSVPVKYREIGDFHEYYSGERTAPCLTVFIGGNHEASNYLRELYYGGWVAPNIYYMGAANVLRLGPLRIAGLSGIWKGYDYRKPHHEKIPYNTDDVKSAFHVREIDVRKLLQIRTQIDIGLSHDWPKNVWLGGDCNSLLRKKPFFKDDIESGSLGSIAAKYVLDKLRPPYWFSAHLHVKFSSVVTHRDDIKDEKAQQVSMAQTDGVSEPPKNDDEIDLELDESDNAETSVLKNADEIDVDVDNDEGTQAASAHDQQVGDDSHRNGAAHESAKVSQELRAQLPASFSRARDDHSTLKRLPPPPAIKNRETRFLALDKCLPGREFLQMIEVPSANEVDRSNPLRLSYDPEWLAITRVFARELQDGDPSANIPADKGDAYYSPLVKANEAWVTENLNTDDMFVPEDFEVTAPVYEASLGLNPRGQNLPQSNAHTDNFCKLLQIPNPFRISEEEIEAKGWLGQECVPMPDAPSGGDARSRGHPGRGRGRGRGRRFRGGGFRGQGSGRGWR